MNFGQLQHATTRDFWYDDQCDYARPFRVRHFDNFIFVGGDCGFLDGCMDFGAASNVARF